MSTLTPNQNRILEILAHSADSKPGSTTLGDLQMDSLDILDVLMEIEVEFQIQIPDDGWTVDTTIEAVVEDVERLIGGKS
ncbi:phosphopantetheine-binding protein [Devosia riboflavina]|uniref:phosphopantetheine-binding protein n=1 Tax=Devosia riboflavina TaxID=46914 RepID=UPI000557BEA5|nr:phosphopantetheine-binding protein [Devosia riboflavina]